MRCMKCNKVYGRKYCMNHVCKGRRRNQLTDAFCKQIGISCDDEDRKDDGGRYENVSRNFIPKNQLNINGEGAGRSSRNRGSGINVRTYTCFVCGTNFSWGINLKHHITSVHSRTSFTCSICRKVFSTQWYLSQHEDKCRQKAEQLLPCRFCARMFKSEIELMRHEDYYHTKEVRYPCRKSIRYKKDTCETKRGYGSQDKDATSLDSSCQSRKDPISQNGKSVTNPIKGTFPGSSRRSSMRIMNKRKQGATTSTT